MDDSAGISLVGLGPAPARSGQPPENIHVRSPVTSDSARKMISWFGSWLRQMQLNNMNDSDTPSSVRTASEI